MSVVPTCKLVCSMSIKGRRSWEIFSHENRGYPLSLSEFKKLRKCLTKFNFLLCLNGLADVVYHPPNVGTAFVNINPPLTFNTYGEYGGMELKSKF